MKHASSLGLAFIVSPFSVAAVDMLSENGIKVDAWKVPSGEIVQTQIRKYYPPDTTAGIFWLKNRKPAEWRDKQEVEHSGNVTIQASPLDERL